MSTPLRRTPATVAVLRVLVNSDAPIWGLQVCKSAGKGTGSVYPILDRLESAGVLTSHWEDSDRRGPRRRLYTLTGSGRGWALAQLQAAAAAAGPGSVRRSSLPSSPVHPSSMSQPAVSPVAECSR